MFNNNNNNNKLSLLFGTSSLACLVGYVEYGCIITTNDTLRSHSN